MPATFRRVLNALTGAFARAHRSTPIRAEERAAERDAVEWLTAHQDSVTVDSPGTSLIHADHDVQRWMVQSLRTLGYQVDEPVMLTAGWVPARNQVTAQPDSQPFVSVTTPTKAKAFARTSDPATSKAAGAAAATRQAITAASHQGMLLAAFATQHASKPGTGFTTAEAVAAAGLHTDGITGSPWHRVTDLRDMGLLTPLLDNTSARVRRRNESKSEADVLVLTTLGVRAARALSNLTAAGYLDEPLVFDGYAAPTLFGHHAQNLAIVTPDAA